MTEKLKPCPFCGSTKLKIESKRTFNYNKRHCSVTVRCMKCHARSPVVGINVDNNQYNERELCESQVTESWNERVSEPEHRPIVHAHWTFRTSYSFKCSNCGEIGYMISHRFCPNCGAKMDESEDDKHE